MTAALVSSILIGLCRRFAAPRRMRSSVRLRFSVAPCETVTPSVSVPAAPPMITPIELEFSADEMRAMADQVIARSIEHVATAAAQPSCGDVDAPGIDVLCRAMREPPPEHGAPLN